MDAIIKVQLEGVEELENILIKLERLAPAPPEVPLPGLRHVVLATVSAVAVSPRRLTRRNLFTLGFLKP